MKIHSDAKGREAAEPARLVSVIARPQSRLGRKAAIRASVAVGTMNQERVASLREWTMGVVYVSGDPFGNQHGAQAFAQGCNCQGSMGAGIAVGFRERYPAMYAEYRRRCKAKPREFNIGDCFLWKSDAAPWVFSMGTQEDTWRSRATYVAVETALRAMRTQADAEGVRTIAVPRIGAGYGGLSWTRVRGIIESLFADWNGSLYVYEEYVAERAVEPAD
jgi:O-acetyl-ADP-ribose deacetylase (regulator of RNase III)